MLTIRGAQRCTGMNVQCRAFSVSRALDVVCPATGKKVNSYEEDTIETIRQKSKKAAAAQHSWAKVPLKEKIKIIDQFGKTLEQNREKYAKDLSAETGKPITQAHNEIKGVQPRINFFTDNVSVALETHLARTTETFHEEVRKEPLGVIANISAWNYPYFVGANVFLPALLTGNTVLYKPSERCPQTGLNIAESLHASGVPKDVFVPIIGKGAAGEAMLDLPEISGVFFTGSLSTGRKIAQTVGQRMLRLQLELGGKDAFYVSDDVDVDKAASALADGAFYNTGQSCCSVERIYVNEKVYEKFVKRFVDEVKTFKMGEPADPTTYIGPLTLPTQIDVLEAQVQDALAKGAKVLVGGKRASRAGNYFEPTVLVDVNHKMDVMVQESFGPIIGIQKVTNTEQAIQLMNDTIYGLTSGVYTRNEKEAHKVMTSVSSGTTYWNACDRVSPFTPWSGRRGSGIGATLGQDGIQAFVQPKSYHFIKP
ncbi:aldehyde dehydrogenase [Planoprotostelium fungivorum]|uniref:Aldehyde dehydrogenase n=1 Tax=Planoprotostelium fungivorum TaxID=1890364 RepID=A0A2P6NPM8_9EUKA|nr:aldehyde dehydrogenase [Planoprotostelium fungivorum]